MLRNATEVNNDEDKELKCLGGTSLFGLFGGGAVGGGVGQSVLSTVIGASLGCLGGFAVAAVGIAGRRYVNTHDLSCCGEQHEKGEVTALLGPRKS